MRLLRNSLATICFILAFFFLVWTVILFAEPTIEGKEVSIGITIFLIVAGLLLKTKTQGRINLERERAQLGIIEVTNANHLQGLSIARNTRCQLTLYHDRLDIEGAGINFNLPIDQITYVNTDAEYVTRKEVESSIIKGNEEHIVYKDNSKRREFLLINYISTRGTVASIKFEDDISPSLTKRIVKLLKPKLVAKQQNVNVQL